MTYTATYSPEDNKLRLYASSRLPPEDYARVKAAGFKWAPKQDLFFAPMWTPEREDLCIELAGDVDDEDRSLVARAEERAERFEGYEAARLDDAECARKAVAELSHAIPMGQPILVGHHSEKRARKDAERIENGMRKAVQMWRTSEYWSQRAAGAIRHAKYKERPDVRARRIKGLEADERKILKGDKGARAALGAWKIVRGITDPESQRNVALRTANLQQGPYGIWSDLKDGKITPIEAADRSEAAMTERTDHARRWLEHYAGRLAYERAMLAEAGGTVADRTTPEKGGGVRCWASPRMGWSYVQKVNKVSVTVLDNWGNGGANFTRTIPFDKLGGVMSAADVHEARMVGRLVEESTGLGFYLRDSAPAPTPAPEPTTDAAPFKAMAESLRAGVTVVSAPQLFPTPPELAAHVAALADIRPGHRVLEPSAGTGALVAAAITEAHGCTVMAVEINAELCKHLRNRFDARVVVMNADFLNQFAGCAPDARFDRIVMNPPFTNGADITHIEHARTMLAPGGRLVALCAAGPRQRAAFEQDADEWIDLPAGSFAEAGTNVSAAIVVFEAPSPVAEVAEAIELAERNAAPLADVPFSLVAPVSQRKAKQEELF